MAKRKRVLKIFLWLVTAIIALNAILASLILRGITLRSLVSALESYTDGAPQILKKIVDRKDIIRDYSTIPDIMTFSNGDAVENYDNFMTRQEEMLLLFKDNIYGDVPNIDYEITFNILEESEEALDGNAIRKQVEVVVTTEYGQNKSVLLLYIPKSTEPIPVFLGLNFKGNTTILDDENIIPSYGRINEEGVVEETPGERYDRWVVDYVINQGYALATVCADDFAPDNKKTYNSRIIAAFGGDTGETEFKTISAWAFGLSKMIDYLIEDEMIDNSRIITVGHSRMGKTSLWAGAIDERVALAISSGSGSTGAALARGNIGETVGIINKYVAPHWFVDKYNAYSKNEDEMPVDQHMLLALMYPRKVYVASSTRD